MAKVEKYKWHIDEDLPSIDDHSIVKLDIIERYIEIYLSYLSKNCFYRNLKFTIVDGFSGGGLYKNNIFGSPIRIKNAIENAKKIIAYERETNKCPPLTFNIDFKFIEKNKNTYNFLTKTLNDFNLCCDKTTCINGKFTTHIDTIINDIKSKSKKNGRSIFILDQYGYKDAPIPVIRKIFLSLKKAEVILTFSIDSLIDYLTENNPKVLQNMGLTKEECERIFDEKADNDFSRSTIQPILYKTIVNQVGAPFYTPFFIKSDTSNRAYWLFHFSTHPTARDEMVKLHWEKQNTFIHYGKEGLNMLIGYGSSSRENLFNNHAYKFDDFAKEKSIHSLSSELPKLIYNYKEVSFENLKNSILNETPATVDIIKESLADAMECGEIVIKSQDKVSKRMKYNSIKKDDILIWNGQRQLSLPFDFLTK